MLWHTTSSEHYPGKLFRALLVVHGFRTWLNTVSRGAHTTPFIQCVWSPSFPSHITCRYMGVRRLVLSDCADDAYIQWTGTWLVRIMASRPITTNPSLKPKLADSLKHLVTKLGESESFKLSFKKGHLNRSSAKWWQVCSGLSMLYQEWGVIPATDWCEADGYGEIDRSLLGSQWPNSGFHFIFYRDDKNTYK